VLVSRTVKDLVVGSEIQFDDRGSHALTRIERRPRRMACLRRGLSPGKPPPLPAPYRRP
jgi:hypothetical protein